MPDVLEARSAYEQAQKDAIELRARARLRLGRASYVERKKMHHSQQDVADTLGVVVEQVRRWESEWRKWQEAHPGQEP